MCKWVESAVYCFWRLTSYRDEKQGRTHSCRATVEPLLAVSQPADYHADALKRRTKQRASATHVSVPERYLMMLL